MTERYDVLPDLAALVTASLQWRRDAPAFGLRIAEMLGLSEHDRPERVAEVLREALGLPEVIAASKPLELAPEPLPVRPVFEVFHADQEPARTYLLGCGCQVTPARGAVVGAPYACAVHGDTTVTMMIPLPAAAP